MFTIPREFLSIAVFSFICLALLIVEYLMRRKRIDGTEMTRADDYSQHGARPSGEVPTAMLPRDRVREPESATSASKAKGKGKSMEEDYEVMDHLIHGLGSLASASTSKGRGKGKEEDYDVVDHLLRGFYGSASASKSRDKGKGQEEEYDSYDSLERKCKEDYDLLRKRVKEDYDLLCKSIKRDFDLLRKSIKEDCDVMDHHLRGPGSPASTSKSRDRGKGKEEDHGVIGNPESREDEIAAIERQIEALNERKNELQGTELLDKLEELHKKIHDLAKAVPENIISARKQALARSGVDSAEERSRTQTGRPSPDGRSGSREERSKNQTGRRSSNGVSGSRGRAYLRHGGRQHGDIRGSGWRRAPGYGYDRPQHGNHDASDWGRAPEYGHSYSGPQGW